MWQSGGPHEATEPDSLAGLCGPKRRERCRIAQPRASPAKQLGFSLAWAERERWCRWPSHLARDRSRRYPLSLSLGLRSFL